MTPLTADAYLITTCLDTTRGSSTTMDVGFLSRTVHTWYDVGEMKKVFSSTKMRLLAQLVSQSSLLYSFVWRSGGRTRMPMSPPKSTFLTPGAFLLMPCRSHRTHWSMRSSISCRVNWCLYSTSSVRLRWWLCWCMRRHSVSAVTSYVSRIDEMKRELLASAWVYGRVSLMYLSAAATAASGSSRGRPVRCPSCIIPVVRNACHHLCINLLAVVSEKGLISAPSSCAFAVRSLYCDTASPPQLLRWLPSAFGWAVT